MIFTVISIYDVDIVLSNALQVSSLSICFKVDTFVLGQT